MKMLARICGVAPVADRSNSYSEFVSCFPSKKSLSDPFVCRWVYRPFSFPIAWKLASFGVSANAVTLISIGFSVVAALMIAIGQYPWMIAASVLMLLVALGDCVDGNIARAKNTSGPGGEWMDALCGYTVYALLPLALGLHLELVGTEALFAGMWVLAGAVTAISNLYLRLVYQKYANSIRSAERDGDGGSKGGMLSRISGELGLVGWMMPALLLAVVLGLEPFYLLFYCALYLASAVVGTIVLARRILHAE